MSRTIFALFFLFIAFVSIAQEAEEQTLNYTYASDKQFNKANDLTGYTFVPNEYEESEYGIEFITEGNVAIHFFDNRILFKGVEGYKSLNIISKNPFKLGYEIEWMDAVNSGISGKIRIVTDTEKFAQLLYINSKTTPEYTFYLPLKSKQLLEQEEKYYTSKREISIRNYPRLIGETIFPYRIRDLKSGGQDEKVNMSDSTHISFKENAIYFKKGALDKTYTVKKTVFW